MQLGLHAIDTQLHLLAHPLATPNRLEFVVDVGSKPTATELTYKDYDVSDHPMVCLPHRSVRPPTRGINETLRQPRACGHAFHLFRAEASHGFMNSSPGAGIEKLHLSAEKLHLTADTSPPLPPRGEGGVPARPPSEPPQGGWHYLLLPLAAGTSPYPLCACYFSNTAWIISQAMPTEGGERAPPGSLLMACQTMQTGPLLPPPLCIHWLRCGLNPYGTRRFYPPGTRRFYLYSLAKHRSPNRLLEYLPTSVGTRGSVV